MSFFFQAEDGIRDKLVTGVQTCALPILTESKDFENYVLVEEPAEKTVKMTKEEQVLKYYYSHVSGGVIEKHIDAISGQILANAVHKDRKSVV